MSRPAIAAALIGLLATAAVAPVYAEGPAPRSAPNTDSEQALCVTIERLIETLGQALQGLPRYAPPEIDSHGNIILRRLPPPWPHLASAAPAGRRDAGPNLGLSNFPAPAVAGRTTRDEKMAQPGNCLDSGSCLNSRWLVHC